MPTFAEAHETAIAIHREGWWNVGKSRKQWWGSFHDDAMRLGHKRVDPGPDSTWREGAAPAVRAGARVAGRLAHRRGLRRERGV
ncbi:MAG: hypothetical protein OXU81_16215, partial [Gammaproteobacteria bacterium]|nr:hypothetical protein [Gammaproteobacteria bacterium]